MDGGTWQAAVQGVVKSWTYRVTSLSIFTFMHWRRKWQPTPVFLPGESQGRGSLAHCRLWGCTESDMTEATQQQQQQPPSSQPAVSPLPGFLGSSCLHLMMPLCILTTLCFSLIITYMQLLTSNQIVNSFSSHDELLLYLFKDLALEADVCLMLKKYVLKGINFIDL